MAQVPRRSRRTPQAVSLSGQTRTAHRAGIYSTCVEAAPARSPTPPPKSLYCMGGGVGERAGATSVSVTLKQLIANFMPATPAWPPQSTPRLVVEAPLPAGAAIPDRKSVV